MGIPEARLPLPTETAQHRWSQLRDEIFNDLEAGGHTGREFRGLCAFCGPLMGGVGLTLARHWHKTD